MLKSVFRDFLEGAKSFFFQIYFIVVQLQTQREKGEHLASLSPIIKKRSEFSLKVDPQKCLPKSLLQYEIMQ